MRLPLPLRWTGLIVVVAIVLALTEIAIEYLWLGRSWSPGRMWVNLILVSIVMMMLFRILFELPGCLFWGLAVFAFLGSAVWPTYLLYPLFKNPAINWAGGQQWTYILVVLALLILCGKWVDQLIEDTERALFHD